jgi:hypothetical protein
MQPDHPLQNGKVMCALPPPLLPLLLLLLPPPDEALEAAAPALKKLTPQQLQQVGNTA